MRMAAPGWRNFWLRDALLAMRPAILLIVLAKRFSIVMITSRREFSGAHAFSVIDVHELVFEYPTTRALKGISLHVPAQTITALVGPNGAGKTTLLRCLAALEAPYSGHVEIDGLDTARAPREVH